MRKFSITAYDKRGNILSEVEPSSVRCAWVLNNIGTMEMIVPLAKANESTLHFGNFIRFDHEILPSWGGVIWGARRWSAEAVAITVYDGLFQLKRRVSAADVSYEGTSKAVAQAIIAYANRRYDSRLRGGSLYDGLLPASVGGSFVNLWDAWREVAARFRVDYWTVPSFDSNGKIIFEINVADSAGFDFQYAFEEGVNLRLESANLQEFCDVQNAVYIYGDGDNDDVVQKAYAENTTSIERYGLTEIAEKMKLYLGLISFPQAELYVQEHGKDIASLTANVLDVNSAWSYLRLGSRIKVWLYSVGFSEAFGIGTNTIKRIMAMQYNSNDETVAVTFKDGTS